jgi:phage FluMu protein Com
MGLYSIPCRQCGQLFTWFSGFLDQRCPVCRRPSSHEAAEQAIAAAKDPAVKWDNASMQATLGYGTPHCATCTCFSEPQGEKP